MPVRPALLPLASALHHDVEAAALERVILGRSLLDHQLRLLRESGHDPIILLAFNGEALPACDMKGVRLARSGVEAAKLVGAAEMATLLGHGVLMMPSLLAHGAGPAEGLLVRHSGMGWERIDAERDWAGALRLPAEVVHAALLDLGEWDPQATLLRVAVQRNAQQRQVATDEVAHGFDGGGAAVLMAADAERRVRRDDGLISLSVQRLLRPVAMWLSNASTSSLADVALVLSAGAAVGVALLGKPATAFALGLVAVMMLSLTLAERRLRRAGEAHVRTLSLLALASLPVVGAWRAEGGTAPLLGVALFALVGASSDRHGLRPWARLDVVFAGLWLGTVVLKLSAALPLGLVLLAIAPALRPATRQRMVRLLQGVRC